MSGVKPNTLVHAPAKSRVPTIYGLRAYSNLLVYYYKRDIYQPTEINNNLLNDFAHFQSLYVKLTSNDFIMSTISINIHLTH